jgi:AcrR family transcriptional regulator
MIAAAALDVVDAEGPDALTMRRLGLELGVDPTAVYRHFHDKEALLVAVADRMLVSALDGYTPTGDWRNDLIDLACRARRAYLAHPSFAQVLALLPSLEQDSIITERMLEALFASGVDDDTAAWAFNAIVEYTIAVSSLHAALSDERTLQLWRQSMAVLPVDRYPRCVAMAPRIYRADEEQFRFGLELMLDTISRRTGPTAGG